MCRSLVATHHHPQPQPVHGRQRQLGHILPHLVAILLQLHHLHLEDQAVQEGLLAAPERHVDLPEVAGGPEE